jgi:insulysin
MEKLVVDFFTPIENKNVIVPDFTQPKAYDETNLGFLYKIEPVMEENKVNIFIPIKYCERMFATKPAEYLSHCLGHEGEGSLLSALIRDDLAVSLTSYSDNLLNCLTYLMISIQLTDKGLDQYEEVIKKAFSYLKMMRIEGPNEDAFEEASKKGDLNWAFIEKRKVFGMVTNMTE